MVILIDDDISPYYGVSAERVNKQLKSASGDIRVEISSYGGDTFEGIRIHNLLKKYDKGDVTTVIMSHAISSSSYVFLAGKKRIVYDNSTYMAHNASNGVYGDYRVMEKNGEYSRKITEMIAGENARISSRDKAIIQEEMNDEKYFFGQEIVDAGYATELLVSGKIETFNKTDSMSTLKTKRVECDMKNSQECLKNFKKEGYSEDLKSLGNLLDSMDKLTQNQEKEQDMDVSTSNGIKIYAATATASDREELVTMLGGATAAQLTQKSEEVATLTASHKETLVTRDEADKVVLTNATASMSAVLTMLNDEKFSGVSKEDKKKTLDEVTLSSDGKADMGAIELSLFKTLNSKAAPQGGGDNLGNDEIPEETYQTGGKF